MPLTGKLLSSYIKVETGNRVYRYLVNGSDSELKAFKESVGDKLKLDPDTGKPIFFATRYVSDNIKILITSEGKAVTDDTEISKLKALVDQYGIDVARLILSQQKNSPLSEE